MGDSAAVLERLRDPKYTGWLPRDAPDVGTGEAGTFERGTVVRIQVRIDRQTRRISEAVFKAFGGSAAIASGSLMAERLRGVTVDEGLALESMTIVAELSLPLERASVAGLTVEATRLAIDDWERKQ